MLFHETFLMRHRISTARGRPSAFFSLPAHDPGQWPPRAATVVEKHWFPAGLSTPKDVDPYPRKTGATPVFHRGPKRAARVQQIRFPYPGRRVERSPHRRKRSARPEWGTIPVAAPRSSARFHARSLDPFRQALSRDNRNETDLPLVHGYETKDRPRPDPLGECRRRCCREERPATAFHARKLRPAPFPAFRRRVNSRSPERVRIR